MLSASKIVRLFADIPAWLVASTLLLAIVLFVIDQRADRLARSSGKPIPEPRSLLTSSTLIDAALAIVLTFAFLWVAFRYIEKLN
jgi:hypothetical protein